MSPGVLNLVICYVMAVIDNRAVLHTLSRGDERPHSESGERLHYVVRSLSLSLL